MQIPDIKRQLSILQTIQHYGLKPNGNNMLCCPFHEDKTPSFQVYPKTNTWCCFSSNCDAGTGDVIEFIQKMEQCTKHQAIEKAKSLLSPMYLTEPVKPATSPVSNNGHELSRIAIMQKFFDGCRKGISGAHPRCSGYAIPNFNTDRICNPGMVRSKDKLRGQPHFFQRSP